MNLRLVRLPTRSRLASPVNGWVDALVTNYGDVFRHISDTLDALEQRMNEALAAARWGHVALHLDTQDRSLRFQHRAAPCIPLAADPDGAWVGAVLEGLYGGWLAAQPGGGEAGEARVRLVSLRPGQAVLAFGQ